MNVFQYVKKRYINTVYISSTTTTSLDGPWNNIAVSVILNALVFTSAFICRNTYIMEMYPWWRKLSYSTLNVFRLSVENGPFVYKYVNGKTNGLTVSS